MNFHPDDFVALSLMVDAEGGKLHAEPCEGHSVRYRVKDWRGRKVWERFQTTHCGQSALMSLPYDPTEHVRVLDAEPGVLVVDHPGEQTAATEVKVCAVDDCVGLWPRYASVVSDRSYQL